MFFKRTKRKVSNKWSLYVVFAVIVIASCVILWMTRNLLIRLDDNTFNGDKYSKLQDLAPVVTPIQPLQTVCPTCKPCSTVSSSINDNNNKINLLSGIEDKRNVNANDDNYNNVGFHLLNCSIPFWNNHNNHIITCVERGDDVYMPVSFINSFFEVYGEIKRDQSSAYYKFQYSHGKLFNLASPYHPGGPFNNFDHYNVEQRSKVLCVTATDGIPLTTQWKADGYYYTITVAQYGLSHHAKALTIGNPAPRILADGRGQERYWTFQEKESILESRKVNIGGVEAESVLFFSTFSPMEENSPKLKIPFTKNSSLCLDIYFINGTGGITVTIAKKDRTLGYVHFDHKSRVWETEKDVHVYHGMGLEKQVKWVRLVRDIAVDWNKAFSKTSIRSPTAFDHIVEITLHGTGYLDNFTIAASHHMEHLIKAADWLHGNQDTNGGWPTDFAIKTGPIRLDPGWYSAMGQGQAMSTLVRAYNISRKSHYLDTAVKALHLFTISSKEGGVKTQFMDKLDWYEEYPTTPYGTFVLNGFIFSLLGLYDLMGTAQGNAQSLAKELWISGLESLKSMLGMFDSGTGTFYDLRHVVYHDEPNRARWDYHMVHIQLIQQLAIIDGDPLFNTTALRWIRYTQGKRAKHN